MFYCYKPNIKCKCNTYIFIHAEEVTTPQSTKTANLLHASGCKSVAHASKGKHKEEESNECSMHLSFYKEMYVQKP